LLRRARKYYIVPPAITRHGDENDDPQRGWMSGTWYLRPTAVASLRREIEDAQKRRRETWETRVRIFGGVAPWLSAILSALAAAILAWRTK